MGTRNAAWCGCKVPASIVREPGRKLDWLSHDETKHGPMKLPRIRNTQEERDTCMWSTTRTNKLEALPTTIKRGALDVRRCLSAKRNTPKSSLHRRCVGFASMSGNCLRRVRLSATCFVSETRCEKLPPSRTTGLSSVEVTQAHCRSSTPRRWRKVNVFSC